MFFESISNIRKALKTTLKSSIKVPNIAIWLFVTRIARNPLGENLLKDYVKACKDESYARQTFVAMLLQLQPLLEMAAVSPHGVYRQEFFKSSLSLKELIDYLVDMTSWEEGNPDILLSYLLEARNMYVHNGVIIKGNGIESIEVLNPYHEFTYKDLCTVVMLTLVQVFYWSKPEICKMAILKYPKCLISMVATYVCWGIRWIEEMWGMLLSVLGMGIGGLLSIFLLFFIVSTISALNQCSRSHQDKYTFTEIETDSLRVWVEEMTPYEQMKYLDNRRLSLWALGDNHQVGDSVVTAADRRTEELYAWALVNGMPDINAWYADLFPNAWGLSRQPVYGLYLNAKGEPNGIQAEKSSKAFTDAYMPVYADGYYPLLQYNRNSSGRYASEMFVQNIGKALAARPGIKIMISVGTRGDKTNDNYQSYVEENRNLADKLKASLKKGGVRDNRIQTITDDKSHTVDILIKKE